MTLRLAIHSRGTPVIFVVLSLLLLLLALLTYSQIFLPGVFAVPPDGCFGDCGDHRCNNDPQHLQATCCWQLTLGDFACQTCNVNTDTGEYENCTVASRHHIPVNSGKILGGGTLASPNAAPSPKTCPDGSTPDANGNCPSTNANQRLAPLLTSPSQPHHKGSNNLFGGQKTTTKKGSSNKGNSSAVP
jgi:hypothetical protein